MSDSDRDRSAAAAEPPVMTSESSSSSYDRGVAHSRMEPETDQDKPHPSEFLEFVSIIPSRLEHHDEKADLRTDRADSMAYDEPAGRMERSKSSDDLFAGLSSSIPGFTELSNDAQAATNAEHKMTFMQGIRLYPKAIGWSILLSCSIIMEGYDLTLINSFYAFPVFRRSYGTAVSPTDSQISPSWQSALTNGAVAGEILGLMVNGFLTDQFGYHRTMILSLIWLCVFVCFAFFAFNIEMLMASEVLCGLSWGVFQTLSTTYAAEVMPVALRAYLTSNVNMCWLIGQLMSVGIIRGLVRNNSQWSYRIPFGLQWAFAFSILVGVVFAPESPWWLIRHGKPDEAKRSLQRLTAKGENFNVDETISMMKHTNEVEKYLKAGTTYLDCFRGVDLRRTEIAALVWCTQALCGSALTGYAAYFYEQAGFDATRAFDLSVGMYGLAICGGIISWFSMRVVGRRTLYLWGLVGSFIVLMVAGGVAMMPESAGQSWALGSLIIFLTFVYDSTIGPVCYTLVAEIPSTRLRVKTVVLARVAYNIVSLINNVITPRMLNPTAWNWKGKACFLFAGQTLFCLLWCYYRLPEPKGLTYIELDILFQKKAKARNFRRFQVNLASTGYFSLTENAPSGSVWRGYS